MNVGRIEFGPQIDPTTLAVWTEQAKGSLTTERRAFGLRMLALLEEIERLKAVIDLMEARA